MGWADALVEALPGAVVRVRRDGLVLDCKVGRTSEIAAFIRPSDLVGARASERFPPEAAALVTGGVEETLATGGLVSRVFETSGGPMGGSFWEGRFSSCGPDEALIVVRDVTESRCRGDAERLVLELGRLLLAASPASTAAAVEDALRRTASFIGARGGMMLVPDNDSPQDFTVEYAWSPLGIAPSIPGLDPRARSWLQGCLEHLEEPALVETATLPSEAPVLQWLAREYGLAALGFIPVVCDADRAGVIVFGYPTPPERVGRLRLAALGSLGHLLSTVRERHRRETEEWLRAAENRFRSLVRHSADITLVLDEEARLTFVSPSIEDVLGYPPEALLGKDVFEYVHPDDVDDAVVGFAPVGTGREGRTLRVRHADGSWHYLESVMSDQRDDPTIAGFVAIARDVTERVEAEAALRESEAAEVAAVVALQVSETRLRELVARSAEMITIVERDGRVLWASPASERLLGYSPEIPEGAELFFWDAVHPDDRALSRAGLAEAQRQPGVPLEVEGRGRHADGTWRWFVTTITDLSDDPAVGGIVLNVHDVTRLRGFATQEAALARLGQRALSGLTVADLVAETVAAIVEVLDVDLVFHAQIGPGGEDLLVRASAGRIGAPSDALPIGAHTHWGQALATTATLALPKPGEPAAGSDALLAAGVVRGMTVGIAAGGEPFGVLGAYATAQREFRPDETDFLRGAANVLASAIERRQFERDLEHQMLHDRLTGLPNRMLLEDRLDQALRRGEHRDGCVTALLIDLDDFKGVNDSLGHAVGDVLLQAVATRIGGAISPADTLARFGGDEFVVVVEHDTQTPDGATAIAERVLAALQAPFQVMPDHELFVTASIGIALGDDVDMSPATLISEADLAMYRAKRRGGDTYVVFDEGLRTRMQARLDLVGALRHALDLDEFHLNYQPEIDLATGRIVDVEALLRWEHPQDGLLAPDTFLDTAEQTGLIIPIGEWVITQACAQAATWQRTYGARAPQRVFVNLSARQLLHPDLGATVEHALQTTGLDPSHLGFEVTEHVFIDDLAAAADILGRLHDHGHALSLDDFGTGYSSLTTLHRLPFDGLKIDQSFVVDLAADRTEEHDTTTIVTATIDMAHDLGLVVTAEGVENPTQAETLTSLGCDRAQGYHYSRPVPADDLAHLLADNDPAR